LEIVERNRPVFHRLVPADGTVDPWLNVFGQKITSGQQDECADRENAGHVPNSRTPGYAGRDDDQNSDTEIDVRPL
jgi:hypothetical protein